jgi:hypothetical protein
MAHNVRRKLRSADPEDEVLLCVRCGSTAVAIERSPVMLLLGMRFLQWKPMNSDHLWNSVEREPWWECEVENGEAVSDE